MTDDTKSVAVAQKAVEPETTQASSPQVEAATTEPQTTQEEAVVQTSSEESLDKLPEDVEEQRRAFQEMRQELKQLRNEREGRVKSESAFNAFRQQTPPVGQQVRVEDYYDPTTGETNWQAYNQAVNGEITKAQQMATFTAQQTAQELFDENNARLKHPDIFSDPELEQEVADQWFAAKMRGENASIVSITDRLAKRLGKAVSKAEKIGVEKALTEVSEKEKAGLVASSQTASTARQEQQTADMQELGYRTRSGDEDAVFARISKIPWANK